MARTSSNASILGIFIRNMVLDGVIFGGIAAFGFMQNWFSEPVRYGWFGNASLLAGLSFLVLAGLSMFVRRVAREGQAVNQVPGAVSDLRAIGVEDDPSVIPVSLSAGTLSFLETYSASLSLALAGMDALMVGIFLQAIGR
jgi:hypothetical protein